MIDYLVRRSLHRMLAAGIGTLLLVVPSAAGEPVIEGYADYDGLCSQLESIAGSKLATRQSLGHTLGGRDVWLVTIGAGNPEKKPAILIVGGVHPPHLVGSELAVRLARRLVDGAESDETVAKLLQRVSFYVIPRPAPDACEAFFRRPYVERAENERPMDDDRDAETDEDPADDLNGDGWITMMRIEDPAGAYMPHPDDARVMIKADPKKNERGRYSLYIEGRDEDEDDDYNEDPAGGVAFNRNFTFRYLYFEQAAGPHQVSEVETRAVADFAFSHPNIGLVLTFTPEDNLFTPWKPEAAAQNSAAAKRPAAQRPDTAAKTSLTSADAPYINFLAEKYRKIHGGKDPPEVSEGHGSFSQWAYFHFGRWSLACRGWWVPKVMEKKEETDEKQDAEKSKPDRNAPDGDRARPGRATTGPRDDQKKPDDDSQGFDDLNALEWFAREKIDGFVDWKRIRDPDFPDKKVEVGGFKPFLRANPPAGALEPLADKHWEFLQQVVGLLPRLEIDQIKAEPLGEDVWRITAVILNEGYLPTMSQMGRTTREPHALQVELVLPEGASLVTGHARRQLPSLSGQGGKAEATWLVRASGTESKRLRVRVWSPSVGTKSKSVNLYK